MTRELLKGNVAIAEAAIRAGLQAYFGYPITPQTELLEHMAARMPELGRAFVQGESELGVINMVYGAACTGARVMSSSSSPGVSLMLEGISYIAATELPVVLVDVMRGGPGLGSIAAAQADYNQIVHGGGHGDYHPLVLAPASVQEAIDLTVEAFDLAEKYRSIVVILLDGSLGQMMEPAELPPMQPVIMRTPEWAANGCEGRERRILSSLNLDPPEQEKANFRLEYRWQQIKAKELRWKEYYMEDAKYAVVGFGSSGRIALSSVRAARAAGIPIGLIRPISVNPFPEQILRDYSHKLDGMLVVEMSAGQMLDDVLNATQGRLPVEFYGRMGGMIPLPDEVLEEIKRMTSGPIDTTGHPRDRWLTRMARQN
ncbi:MAG: 3-methyl-2-oxobutanoate dehydrogenase subunit VorB [Anaerolineaceae bacterium]